MAWGVSEVGARCTSATEVHPYITATDGQFEGLRAVPDADPLHFAGASVADWLVVPEPQLAGGEPVSPTPASPASHLCPQEKYR